MIRSKHLLILAMTTIVMVSLSGCIRVVELSYDDGEMDAGTASCVVGRMCAVRFTPEKSCLLVKAKFHFWNEYSGLATFKVHVMDWISYTDSSYEDLITPFEATPTSEGWFQVNLPHPITVGPEDFYIAIEWVTYSDEWKCCRPYLGEDGDEPYALRSYWSHFPGYPGWVCISNVDFMIRAVVLYIDTPWSYPLEEYL